ncbi:hypothetical protein FACS189472_08390 [Alphaproteobacteria bacterium]|nr:hypothetical protein FACS189472_08390 [Alphaproteobacteria bacterium]
MFVDFSKNTSVWRVFQLRVVFAVVQKLGGTHKFKQGRGALENHHCELEVVFGDADDCINFL